MITTPARRNWLTEGIVVTAIPVMAYLLAFGFEYGFYLAYGFPQELITIDLNRVFVAGAVFLGGAVLLLVPAAVALALLPGEYPLAPAIAQAVTLVLAYVVFLLAYWHVDIVALILLLLLVWYLGYKFGLPLLTQRGVRGYLQKFRMHEQTRQERTTLFQTVLRTLGPTAGMTVVYFFIALVLSVATGWNIARERQYYFVAPGSPERVVLRIYGDSIVLARLDRTARQILREYTVFRRSTGSITLREERIGPLTMEP